MTSPESRISVVAVGSLNPVKVQAVATAMEKMSLRATVLGRSVPSGVSDQPMSAEETLQGSTSRAKALLDMDDIDYAVGLEGGLMRVAGEWFCIGFATVATRAGIARSAMSPGVWVPPEVMDLVHGGMELGDAEDSYYKTENSKQSGGLIGLITSGLVVREETFYLPTVTAFCTLDYEAEL